MKEYPLVSVHIITYNSAAFIRETLESVLAQDYPNFEIVISDDASKDDTPGILQEYQQRYPQKVKIILNPVNQGITKNANVALKKCNGVYLTFLGGDDLFLPGKIKTQVDYMQRNTASVISYHNVEVFQSETNKTLYFYNAWNRAKPHNGDVKKLIKHGCFCSGCSVMIRADHLPKHGYDENYLVASDYVLFLQSLLNGGEIHYIPRTLAKYRRHSANVTNPSSALYKQAVLDGLNLCGWLMFNYPRYAHLTASLYGIAFRAMRHFKEVSYLKLLWESYKLNPSIKVFAGMVCYCFSFGKVKL